MGAFDAVYEETKQALTFIPKDRQERKTVWLFTINGTQIHETLSMTENTLFRVVELQKS